MRTDNITDAFSDFVQILEIYCWSTEPDVAAIFNTRRFINVQDEFWREKLFSTTQRTKRMVQYYHYKYDEAVRAIIHEIPYPSVD